MSTPRLGTGVVKPHRRNRTRDAIEGVGRTTMHDAELESSRGEHHPVPRMRSSTVTPRRGTADTSLGSLNMQVRETRTSVRSKTPSAVLRTQPQTSVRRSPRPTSLQGTARSLTAGSHAPNPFNTSGERSLSTMPLFMGATPVAASSENVEPKMQSEDASVRQNALFTIKGPYVCVVVVDASAALWAANEDTDTVDIFSSITGEMSTRIPARLAATSSSTRKGGYAKPLALKATAHHVWVGYDDGTVAVYDHLCVAQLTAGRFHESPVAAFCVMADGITVSGSVDMALVLWDTEAKNFEAITRIVGVSESHQALTCMTAFGTNIVLCGSVAGNILVVDCASGLQVATLRRHGSRVNALVVMDDLLFSASDDHHINVWNMRGDESSSSTFDFQKSCKLLKCIPVQLAVRDMVSHEGSHSLWVAYVDGLVERWSANPDDDFGVEQIVREASVDTPASQQHEVMSLHFAGKVETMRVLALGSNGFSKVWYGHSNILEDSLQESIDTMNAIIAQDASEALVWERKAFMLKRRELQRKEKYVRLLNRLHVRRILFTFYTRWQTFVNAHRLRGRQHEEICLSLEARYQFVLQRRYFTKWCAFYDREQRRLTQQLSALTLERLSRQTWVARIILRWRNAVMHRKCQRRRQDVVTILLRLSNSVLLLRYFACWRCVQSTRCGALPARKIALLAEKAQHRVRQQVYDGWKFFHAERHARRSLVTVSDTRSRSKGAAVACKKKSYAVIFSEAYAKVTEERARRRVFNEWRRCHEHRRSLVLLRAMAAAKELQCHRDIMHRAFVFWRLLRQKRCLEKMAQEVQEVEKRLREAEEMHADIFDKLQLQKRLDLLRKQDKTERQKLHEELELAQKLNAERDAFRRSFDRNAGANNAEAALGSPNGSVSPHVLFSPTVLQKLPLIEAMSFIMARMKGTVLNLFTDMPLFRQIQDRLRCGTTAAVIFLEGFQEVKRVVVSICKKPAGVTWRSGDRWPLTSDLCEGLPMHLCAAVVQAVKMMVVGYDMVGASEVENVAATSEEIVANADHLLTLWRVSYSARKPVLPVNNRIAVRP